MILFQKGQSIDNRYTVVFPHKEGTYAETYRGRLLPQWFVLPISLEPHCHGVNDWIFRKQRLDVVSERTGGIERTKPVGDVAKLDVKLVGKNISVCYPWVFCSSRQYWHNGEATVPHTGMVGTFVAQNCHAGQPTAQNEMLKQSEFSCYKVFGSMVGKVGIKLRQCAKRQNLKRLPYWRKLRGVVSLEMLSDVIFLRPLYLPTNMHDIGLEAICIFTKAFVCKPERIVPLGEETYHFAPYNNFNLEDGIKYDLLQFCVELINLDDVMEMSVRTESMTLAVCFHRSPIICKPEIAHTAKNGSSFGLVINNKPSLFQSVNLLCEGEKWFGIDHIEKAKSRPVALPKRGRVPGSVGCKGTTFIPIRKIFLGKSA